MFNELYLFEKMSRNGRLYKARKVFYLYSYLFYLKVILMKGFSFIYMLNGEYVFFFNLPPERLDSKKEVLTHNWKNFYSAVFEKTPFSCLSK